MTLQPRQIAIAAMTVALLGASVVGVRTRTQQVPPAPSPTATIAAETAAEQYARVVAAVARIRGLEFPQVPAVSYLSGAALAERAEGFAAGLSETDATQDAAVLAALGAVAEGTDLRALYGAALAEQVAGFYDPATGEMVVEGDPDGRRLGPLGELTLAHELEHALADATLGLPRVPEDLPEGEDAAIAAAALVEGDATLVMEQYVTAELSLLQQLRLAGEASAILGATEALDALPWYLRRGLLFPYTEGLAFVRDVHARGGWAAVDAAYADPPTTTSQVLFPDRYRTREQPVSPRAAATPPEGWQAVRSYGWGALDLLALFEAPGDDRNAALIDPLDAVSGWAGGRLVLWTAPDASDGPDGRGVGMHLVGDQTGELCAAIVTWYQRARPQGDAAPVRPGERLAVDGPSQDAVVVCTGREVRLGIGPDLSTARAAAS